eukprot:gene22650-biopygen13298
MHNTPGLQHCTTPGHHSTVSASTLDRDVDVPTGPSQEIVAHPTARDTQCYGQLCIVIHCKEKVKDTLLILCRRRGQGETAEDASGTRPFLQSYVFILSRGTCPGRVRDASAAVPLSARVKGAAGWDIAQQQDHCTGFPDKGFDF